MLARAREGQAGHRRATLAQPRRGLRLCWRGASTRRRSYVDTLGRVHRPDGSIQLEPGGNIPTTTTNIIIVVVMVAHSRECNPTLCNYVDRFSLIHFVCFFPVSAKVLRQHCSPCGLAHSSRSIRRRGWTRGGRHRHGADMDAG